MNNAGKLFQSIVTTAPAEGARETTVLRVSPHLTLDYGARGLRMTPLAHKGKSRLHIQLDFVDLASDSTVAAYNAYGIGIGFGGFFGASAKHMSKDDLQESYDKLAELLKKEMKKKKEKGKKG